jgi:hypothetical protein
VAYVDLRKKICIESEVKERRDREGDGVGYHRSSVRGGSMELDARALCMLVERPCAPMERLRERGPIGLGSTDTMRREVTCRWRCGRLPRVCHVC